MRATIWHNPRCGTSRNALALLQEAGADVTIVDYLKTPPSREELKRVYAQAGMTPRDGLRAKEAAAAPLTAAGDEEILDAMAADPILIQRPVVQTDKGIVLARPAERVREVL